MVSLTLCFDGFQYETAMCCETPGSTQPDCESPLPIQPVAYHMVNRRYSEFLNLQTRLEEKTELRKLIKGRMEGARLQDTCLIYVWYLSLHFILLYCNHLLLSRCERSKENISRHAIWKHGQ